MSLAELLPTVHSLSRQDKLRLIELLATELIRSEDPASGLIPPGQTYPVWSPDRAYDAANMLLRAGCYGSYSPRVDPTRTGHGASTTRGTQKPTNKPKPASA